MVQVLGFAGSLRKNSLNRSILNHLVKTAPSNLQITPFDLINIPLYNQDVEDQGTPQSVLDFKQAILTADAILIVTPEYNHSVPGVLKNALDWASRSKNAFDKKPVGILGASDGRWGTIRSQQHLRNILAALNCYTMPQPQLFISNADKKLDEDHNLIDTETIQKLKEYLESFEKWIEIFNK